MMTADELQLLTTEQVADLIGVTPETIMKHCTTRRPIIRSVKFGRLRRFRREDVAAFVASQLDHNPRGLAGENAKSKK
jgi:excisionase family DNA binding protein